MAGCPPNRPSSSASTAAVAGSSTSGGPSLLRQRVQRRGSQRGAGLTQRGQVVRGGSPAGTDSRKTVPRSAAPARPPAATPTAAHARSMSPVIPPRVPAPPADRRPADIGVAGAGPRLRCRGAPKDQGAGYADAQQSQRSVEEGSNGRRDPGAGTSQAKGGQHGP